MTVHYVSFSAEINPSTTEGLIAAMSALCNQGATEINILLSTPGGSVMHGITIYNTLRALPVKIITHNMGNVDSIGNVLFLAGSERYACAHSTFMFHGVGFDLAGSLRLEDKMLRERLDSIASDHKRIGDIIGKHSTLQTGDVVQLFTEARTKDAAWAQSVGLINAVREPQIPQGVPVHSLVFNR
jgi:ATP-dependent Clp protease protease subunit